MSAGSSLRWAAQGERSATCQVQKLFCFPFQVWRSHGNHVASVQGKTCLFCSMVVRLAQIDMELTWESLTRASCAKCIALGTNVAVSIQ